MITVKCVVDTGCPPVIKFGQKGGRAKALDMMDCAGSKDFVNNPKFQTVL